MQKIELKTVAPKEFRDITSRIQEAVGQQKRENGIVTIFVPHTSAAITINENADPDVLRDMKQHFEKLVPKAGEYDHAEGNSDAHILSTLCGASVQIIVAKGKLQLGRWQGIFFCEFDGPRTREIWLEFCPTVS